MEKRKILFTLPGCPYCENAIRALDAAGVKYENKNISPGDRSIVELLSGQKTVPILVEVTGSENQDDDIIEALEKNQL